MTETIKQREKSTRELVAASERWSRRAAAELTALLKPARNEQGLRHSPAC